jgi:signal transduction histidine kinase
VSRHAQANSVEVTLAREGDIITLSIQDDGRGIVEDASGLSAADCGSIGLDSIRERAEMLNGECAIRSVPGSGTTIQVRIHAPL